MINKIKTSVLVSIYALFFGHQTNGQTTYTVTNPNGNFTYSPNYLEVSVDDTVLIKTTSFSQHPLQELPQSNYCSGNYSGGNILINYSNSYKLVASVPGIYYYGCTAHAGLGEQLIVNVICNTASSPTAAASQTVAPNTTLGGLSVTGIALTWYNSSAGFGGACPIANTTNVSDGTTYYVSQTIGNCESQRTAITVHICQSPNISSQNISSSSVCEGNNVSYSVSATGTNMSYQWMKDNVIIPTANTAYLNLSNVSNADEGVYNCILTTACGTLSTNFATLTVNALPSLTVSNGSVCEGDTYTFTPGGALTYSYSSTTSTITPSNTDTYTITGTDSHGCINTATCSVSVNSLPVLTATDGTICAGTSYTIAANGANNYTYSSGSNIVSPSSQTTYTITGTDNNGCSNSTLSTVYVNVAVTPSITVNGLTLTSDPAVSYQWYLEGNLINGATSQTVSVTQNGHYSVQITDANGCSATSADFNFTSVGLKDISSLNSVAVYPNPSAGSFELKLNTSIENSINISITDVLGNVVYTESAEITNTDFHKTFDIASFNNGIYFIKLDDRQNTTMVKIVLNK